VEGRHQEGSGAGKQKRGGVAGAIIRAASSAPAPIWKRSQRPALPFPKEVWQDIASTAISKLGTSRNGEWTPAAFVTDFRKLSDRGKALLFRSVGSGDVLPFLNDIAEVSQKFVDRGKLANTSGTAGHNALYAAGGAVAAGLAHGSFVEPLTAIGGIAGINGVARLLAVQLPPLPSPAGRASITPLRLRRLQQLGSGWKLPAGILPTRTASNSDRLSGRFFIRI
jgi:hypothetical protein